MNQLDNYVRQLDEARREVQQADDDMHDASARRHRAQRRIEALSQIVTGLQLLHAEQEDPQRERLPVGDDGDTVRLKVTVYGHEGDEPRGKEAVRIIMSEAPRTWKASELIAEVLNRKWIDPEAKHPDAAVRTATTRLLNDGLIERVGTGRYRYKFPDDPSSGQAARVAGELEAATEKGE